MAASVHAFTRGRNLGGAFEDVCIGEEIRAIRSRYLLRDIRHPHQRATRMGVLVALSFSVIHPSLVKISPSSSAASIYRRYWGHGTNRRQHLAV